MYRYIKLVNNDEILCKVVHEDRKRIKIENPLKFLHVPMGMSDVEGVRFSSILVPLLNNTKQNEIEIKKKHILFEVHNPSDLVLTYYRKTIARIEKDNIQHENAEVEKREKEDILEEFNIDDTEPDSEEQVH